MNNHQHSNESPPSGFWRTKGGVVLIMLFVIAIFYVVREHFAHVYPYLPYLILLICPLMHFFGHCQHGSKTKIGRDEKEK